VYRVTRDLIREPRESCSVWERLVQGEEDEESQEHERKEEAHRYADQRAQKAPGSSPDGLELLPAAAQLSHEHADEEADEPPERREDEYADNEAYQSQENRTTCCSAVPRSDQARQEIGKQ